MPPPRLHRSAALREDGWSARRITTAIRRGELLRVRPGVCVDAAEWQRAFPEEKIVARAEALAAMSEEPPVFSHETAVALHAIGLYRPATEHVHVIATHARPGAASGVVRHRGDLAGDDIVEVRGLRFTSLDRTVADIARTTTFDRAVTVTDAALRRRFVARDTYDVEGAAAHRDALLAIVERSAHGQTRARRAIAFADGRAQLPGESVSRVRLHELGFRRPSLQVHVAGPGSTNYFVDFGIDEANAFGEFDGRIKYVDEHMLDGRTAADAIDREKQREDWIRGVTGRRFARWGWSHIDTAAHLGARLARFGILPLR